jgi:2-oxoglutarate dehydrogenase E2 component (dihydrolipoamide succinyltransferase)
MPTDVIMPQMGESIFEGTITKWLKKAGDAVEMDEPLFEISTDKVDAEIPSPVAGVLSQIKVPEGATVEVNTVVAVVLESGEEQGPGTRDQGLGTEGLGTRDQGSEIRDRGTAASVSAPVAGGIEIVMPQMGESIFEGTITKWLKKAGDAVEKDEPLFEISTDKVDAEIPSPVAGVLSAIKVPEGATVEINTVVAVIGASGARAAAAAVAEEAQSPAPPKPASAEPQAPAVTAGDGERGISLLPVRSSPLVRRIAKDNNLDLRRIAGAGSGLGGRITKDDVLRHLSEHLPGSTAVSAEKQVPLAAPQLPGRVVPMTRMRAIIAQRMVESVAISPHVYTVYKVDMTRIMRLREREKSRFEQKHGVKLTYMPFIAVAAVEALRKFPVVNASLENDAIHYHANINLGIAVSLEWGLIVPVIKQAEQRSFVEIARAMNDLALRARTKKLLPEEVAGGTFTLTNSGVFGGEFGTPIINQPESAILAIGGLKKEAVVLTDAEGNDSIAIRSMQHFCLGFDHRTIDGADSGKFMSAFKKVLEGWDREIG